MRVILDVGANDGSWGLGMAQKYPDVPVYAFEPTPQLCAKIREKVSQLGLRNYELVPVAVSDEPGRARFNIAGQSDWGCSSLLPFAGELEKTWPGREDLKVTEVIEVDCIRLDSFVAERGITGIAFLHTDAQGMDLRVISSLGEHVGKVERGRLETARNAKAALYDGQHTLDEVLGFLWVRGFDIEALTPNDKFMNEVNVTYRRAPGGVVRIR
ncbi:FkbM family methyltransferase [Phenylobacterium sp. LjRoot219]|uniref:FkbM family methyltransferase n=1 Tax=Phenylobacterium sp. LjRoot219 TaxID=3342283 RepID=UPI003ECE4978